MDFRKDPLSSNGGRSQPYCALPIFDSVVWSITKEQWIKGPNIADLLFDDCSCPVALNRSIVAIFGVVAGLND